MAVGDQRTGVDSWALTLFSHVGMLSKPMRWTFTWMIEAPLASHFYVGRDTTAQIETGLVDIDYFWNTIF